MAPVWGLRQGVKLHFYVSELPCGECALVPISSRGDGTLGRKRPRPTEEQAPAEVEELLHDRNRTGAKPAREMPEDPRQQGISFHQGGVLRYKSGRSDLSQEAQTTCYSCSEKICRWNHVGWQGALLARLMRRPITMSSVVVGGPLFDQGFVRQALFERAGHPLGEGIACPAFEHTSVPFRFAREELDTSKKSSTIGLSIVWSPDARGSLKSRSLSRQVPGFYDVLLGSSGERQGQKRDRRPSARPASAAEAPGLSSWVSPLCKRLLAEDFLEVLHAATGSADGGSAAGIPASASPAPAERPPKRQRTAEEVAAQEEAVAAAEVAAQEAVAVGGGSNVTAGPSGDSSSPADATGSTDSGGAVDARVQVPKQPTYQWLKEAMAGSDFRARRTHFHATGLFASWLRKRHHPRHEGGKLSASSVDDFLVELPRPAAASAAPPP